MKQTVKNPVGLTKLGGSDNSPSKKLETFDSKSSTAIVEFFTKEFTANCPITKAPDFYTLKIKYKPGDRFIESKSLKLYLRTFREEGAFIETLVRQIEDDIIDACKPEFILVELEMAPRGGISMKATVGHKFDPVVEMYTPINMGPKGGV